jgi:hypothetical protein
MDDKDYRQAALRLAVDVHQAANDSDPTKVLATARKFATFIDGESQADAAK